MEKIYVCAWVSDKKLTPRVQKLINKIFPTSLVEQLAKLGIKGIAIKTL